MVPLGPSESSLKPCDAARALCWGAPGIEAWEFPTKPCGWGVKPGDAELASAKLPAPNAWVCPAALVLPAFPLLQSIRPLFWGQYPVQ